MNLNNVNLFDVKEKFVFFKAYLLHYIKYDNNFAQSHKSEFRRTIQKEIMNVEHSLDRQTE